MSEYPTACEICHQGPSTRDSVIKARVVVPRTNQTKVSHRVCAAHARQDYRQAERQEAA